MDLTSEAIEKILGLAPPEYMENDGVKFSNQKLYQLEMPSVSPLHVRSLSGVLDWIRSQDHEGRPWMIHIHSPSKLNIVGLADKHTRAREVFLTAQSDSNGFCFDTYGDIESFIISVQCSFAPSQSKLDLLRFVSGVCQAEVRQASDDGISQQVVSKNEIGRLGNVAMNPIIALQPYLTFREIEQPELEFLLRFRKGNDLPQVALHKSKNPTWELEAMERISTYLKNHLPEGVTIIR